MLHPRLSTTTPIFYVNSTPHLGHAYSVVLADAIRRWFKAKNGPGSTGLLYSGTDEHGQKVYEAARKHALEPLQWADNMSRRFQELNYKLNSIPDRFIRTTEYDHTLAVKHLWGRLKDSGEIYEGTHSGWYCVSEECFYPDHELEKISLDGEDILVTKGSRKPVSWIEERNYMFRLSKYRERIHSWISSGVIKPASRSNDLMEYLMDEQNFKDISISRRSSTAKWGIAVPGDEEQMIYVWFDALVNYLTVMGYPSKEEVPNIHVIGKDILKFHAIYWPAFLMAANLPLPQDIVVHGHLIFDGVKMSKSLGNVIDPNLLIDEYGSDSIRYYLLRESNIDSDLNFSAADLINRVNNELANQLGNLVQRAFIPKFTKEILPNPKLSPRKEFAEFVMETCQQTATFYDRFHFHAGLEKLQSLLQESNKLFTESQPWRLIDNGSNIPQLLADVGFALRAYGTMASPVVPTIGDRLTNMFKGEKLYGSIMDRINSPIIDLSYFQHDPPSEHYCDIFLTHDAPRVRRDHNAGWKHAVQVRAHFLAMNQDRMQRTISEIVKDYEVRGELVPVPAPMMMRPPPGTRPPGAMMGMRPGMVPMVMPGQVPMGQVGMMPTGFIPQNAMPIGQYPTGPMSMPMQMQMQQPLIYPGGVPQMSMGRPPMQYQMQMNPMSPQMRPFGDPNLNQHR